MIRMMSKKSMTIYKTLRVLGVDPGTATTGWAVLEEKSGCLSPIAYGCIKTPKKDSESARLLEITSDLEKIIKKYRPQEAAIEKIFFFKNQKTVIPVSQSRGAIILTLERKDVKVFGYTPLQVKLAVTGYGRADKKQIQVMAKNILGLKSAPKPDDVADAIAVAVCHLNSRVMKNKSCN